MAHLRSIDLNLLVILECLYRHRNLTSAGLELGISQSAISHSLTNLRNHYKDPLFVRVSKGVEPTEFAKSIQKEIEDFVHRAIKLTEKVEQFSPKNAKGRIVISTTDYFEVVIGTLLIERLKKEAPSIQISFRPTFGSLPKTHLEDGSYDLAIAGFYKNLPEGFYQQKIFSDIFSTAFRKNHPLLKKEFTLENYYKAEHLLITLQGDFKDSFSEFSSGKTKVRTVKVGSASFTGPAWLIAESDLVLTGPTSLLNRYKKYFPVEVVPCPIAIKPIELQMVWHGLTNQNPLKKWVRQTIKEICQTINYL